MPHKNPNSNSALPLREPVFHDLGALVELLSLRDATRFGVDEPISELAVQELIDRAARERGAGLAATHAITLTASRTLVGLVQVRARGVRTESGPDVADHLLQVGRMHEPAALYGQAGGPLCLRRSRTLQPDDRCLVDAQLAVLWTEWSRSFF